jgi:UTP--glucose-1-phosphate uridylyltransferase
MIKKPIKKAVFPVAGLGTRFLPATKVMPKEMMPIFNKPIVQYAVEEAMDAGIEEFIFVTGRGKVIIEDHFDISYELESHLDKNNKSAYKDMITQGIPKPGKAFFTRQQYPLGLGHAIFCARALLNDEPFAVLLPDEYLHSTPSCLKSMIDLYNSSDYEMILATQEVEWSRVSSYGILDTKQNQLKNKLIQVEDIVEKPSSNEAPSNYAVIGRYILQPSIFEYLQKEHKGVGGEIQLTDSIAKSISSHKTAGYLYDGKRFDCGNPLGLLEASIEVALEDKKITDKVLTMLKSKIK